MSNARLFLGALAAVSLAACGSSGPALPETPAGSAPRAEVLAPDTTQTTGSLGQMGSGYRTEPPAGETTEPEGGTTDPATY